MSSMQEAECCSSQVRSRLVHLSRPARDVFRRVPFVVSQQAPAGHWRLADYLVPTVVVARFSILSLRLRDRELLKNRVASVLFTEYVRQLFLLKWPVVLGGDLLTVVAVLEADESADFVSMALLERS